MGIARDAVKAVLRAEISGERVEEVHRRAAEDGQECPARIAAHCTALCTEPS